MFVKGHGKRFPELVKMLVLYIKINFNQRYIIFFLRNEVTVVLKRALLASNMVETLMKKLRNVTSSLPNKDPKHSTWPCLACVTCFILALLNV